MELPIKVIERESGVIVTEFVRFDPRSEFGRSAIEPDLLESVEEGRYTVNILVMTKSDSLTLVRANAHVEKFTQAFLARTYDWKPIPSTGYIERLVFDDLDKVLAGTYVTDLRPVVQATPTVPKGNVSLRTKMIALGIFVGAAAVLALMIH